MKAVVATGAALLVLHLFTITFSQPVLFLSLVGLAIVAGRMSVALPFAVGISTLSVAYGVDFASMILAGPNATLYVTAAGAFSQCQLNRKVRKPLYETLFNTAILVITVQVAGAAFTLLQSSSNNGVLTAAA